MELNKIYQGNCLEILKTFPNESIDCIVTSPPYWALRNYGKETTTLWDGDNNCEHDFEEKETTLNYVKNSSGFCKKCGAWKGQLGLEQDFNLYIKHLCDIFDECKRVLKQTGTCWVNLGDTYSSKTITKCLPGKNLCLIPFRFALEMQNRRWIIRNVIIWHKSTCLPESVKDRFTVNFEYVFLFVKKQKYYFNQIKEPSKRSVPIRRISIKEKKFREEMGLTQKEYFTISDTSRKNKRCVWTISTKNFHEAHFATYPEELIEPMIKAGCPEFVCNKCGKAKEISCNCNACFSGGIVLDPFFGAGTTGLVALKQNKLFIGIEMNSEYIKIAEKRLQPYLSQSKLEKYSL